MGAARCRSVRVAAPLRPHPCSYAVNQSIVTWNATVTVAPAAMLPSTLSSTVSVSDAMPQPSLSASPASAVHAVGVTPVRATFVPTNVVSGGTGSLSETALAGVVALGGGSLANALISLFFGMLISTVGVDEIYGVDRFTFGTDILRDGIGYLPVMVGAYGQGEVLIRLGDPARHVFFIASGAVEVEFAGQRQRLGRGELFGQLGILTRRPRRAQVTALTHCTLLRLDETRFLDLLARNDTLRQAVAESTKRRGLLDPVARTVVESADAEAPVLDLTQQEPPDLSPPEESPGAEKPVTQ